MKVVINRCYGGFGLSYEGVMEYAKQKGIKLYGFVDVSLIHDKKPKDFNNKQFKPYEGEECLFIHYSKKPLTKKGTYINKEYFFPSDIERHDPALVATVKKLKKKANKNFSPKIV